MHSTWRPSFPVVFTSIAARSLSLRHSRGGDLRRGGGAAGAGSVMVTGVRGDVHGQLVDVSDSGFRMSHSEASFEPGQVVQFAHTETRGQARVIWNRINQGRVETGFFITERI